MRRALLPLIGGLVSLSCSFEFRPESAFNGSYELAAGCQLAVQEDGAAASCASDGIEVKAILDGATVTFAKIALTEKIKQTECWLERTCTETYTGSGVRKVDASSLYDGRFSVISGEWEGKLTKSVACDSGKPASGAPDWCKNSMSDVVYSFTAKIDFHAAEITWNADNGASGGFSGQETKGGVQVADTFYKRVEQP